MLKRLKRQKIARARALLEQEGYWVVQPFHGLWVSGPVVARETPTGNWEITGPPGWCVRVAGTHGSGSLWMGVTWRW